MAGSSGLLTHDGLDLRNQAARRDNPPHCSNCERLERRIKELEDCIEKMQSYIIMFPPPCTT